MLKYLLLGLSGFVGLIGVSVVAMWLSKDVRYFVAYELSERFDLNPAISHARLARQTTALKRVRLIDSKGQPFDWSTAPGAIIWINEWANWCVPCRMEFPAMKALQTRVGQKSLRVVLLSQPQYWEADKRTAKQLGVTFELVSPVNVSGGDLAAINLSTHPNGFLLPESTFMRANGNGLIAMHAIREWDSAVWQTTIQRWIAEGQTVPKAR